MPVRKVIANKNVKDDLGKVCFVRGPITYCAEEKDNPDNVDNAIIPAGSDFKVDYRKDFLGGVSVIRTNTTNKKQELNLVPYCVWNNRGANKMNVWFEAEK